MRATAGCIGLQGGRESDTSHCFENERVGAPIRTLALPILSCQLSLSGKSNNRPSAKPAAGSEVGVPGLLVLAHRRDVEHVDRALVARDADHGRVVVEVDAVEEGEESADDQPRIVHAQESRLFPAHSPNHEQDPQPPHEAHQAPSLSHTPPRESPDTACMDAQQRLRVPISPHTSI